MIPKIIHQTAKSADIPAEWTRVVSASRAKYPDWEYRLWTDVDAIHLIREQRPALAGVFESVPRKVMRADIIRCFLLEQFGGLYFDLDYEFLKTFDFSGLRIVLPRESHDSEPVYLGNAVLASERGHPFWSAVLNRIEEYHFDADTEIKEDDVIDLTGPGLITSVYHESFTSDTSICIPRRLEFNPPIPRSDGERDLLIREGIAYGIHYCYGSWRALTFRQRLFAKVATYAKRVLRRIRKFSRPAKHA